MTEEGRDVGGHRWSPPPPLLLPLPLGEVPARSKGGEGPLSRADRVTALPEGEPRSHPPLRGNWGCGKTLPFGEGGRARARSGEVFMPHPPLRGPPSPEGKVLA